MKTGQTNRKAGFTRKKVVVVIGALAMLSVLLVPYLVKRRATNHRNACFNNLRLLQGGKKQWALENRKQKSDVPTASDLRPYILGRGSDTHPYCEDEGHGLFYCPDDPLKRFANSTSSNTELSTAVAIAHQSQIFSSINPDRQMTATTPFGKDIFARRGGGNRVAFHVDLQPLGERTRLRNWKLTEGQFNFYSIAHSNKLSSYFARGKQGFGSGLL